MQEEFGRVSGGGVPGAGPRTQTSARSGGAAPTADPAPGVRRHVPGTPRRRPGFNERVASVRRGKGGGFRERKRNSERAARDGWGWTGGIPRERLRRWIPPLTSVGSNRESRAERSESNGASCVACERRQSAG
eukprot:CAMPEP_0119482666 /NCGR_PEP_ID=MMETSP1344-20130328/10423_1 /TAXON_ID=236787 /ORGANISM="Florenciella parvula, Strain CCMP2471" /LENGTH=132 /DNA_ID=CAMNT_0007517093 /DNA_START=125 /DNA_END=520 /DNA_ORIENTATION=-